jgi:hypothetical protein
MEKCSRLRGNTLSFRKVRENPEEKKNPKGPSTVIQYSIFHITWDSLLICNSNSLILTSKLTYISQGYNWIYTVNSYCRSENMVPETKLLEKKTESDTKLKLFISYSHQDNTESRPFVKEFKKHLAPLKSNGLVEEWYDREILGGDDFQEKIDNKLENAHIICLFISANFLDSHPCMDEKRKALEFRKMKGIPVVPIILSPCGWLDTDLKKIIAFPTDGKPITSFSDRDAAWQDVYENLKRVINRENKLRRLALRDTFKNFLDDAEIFTNAHSQKEIVTLNDIYVNTELKKFDSSKKHIETITSDELTDNLFREHKIILAGENQSGKTALCKRVFCKVRKLNFIPVYVPSKTISLKGKIDNLFLDLLHEQYENFDDKEIDFEKIIPIIDDFHYINEKEKQIKRLIRYSRCIIVVDDIFSLNIKDEELILAFTTFKMKELKPSIRIELIQKWVSLSDKKVEIDYKELDKHVELIDITLGRNIGKGFLPAYPFFIISTLFTYDTYSLPLNQDITSQGHCYQAFIYYYLTTKRHVKFDEIDTYLNFLSELAFYMHHVKKNELSYLDFSVFMEGYTKKYNFPIERDILLDNLYEIVGSDSLNNYSFRYSCFYYYFVAKALSEHLSEPEGKEKLKNILNNLHVDENAYIAVFLIHHSKNIDIFNEIEIVSSSLFGKFNPATLAKDEMTFFDSESHNIVKALLPPAHYTPEMERERRLKIQDQLEASNDSEESKESEKIKKSIEEKKEDYSKNDDLVDKKNTSLIDLRKAIKTVEVMGCVIRNRAGSLERDKLQKLFLCGMNVHLRALSSFIEIIKDEKEQKLLIDFISKRLSMLDEGKDPSQRLSEEKRQKIALNIFWNLNFFVVYGVIFKIVHSLGSDRLIEISNQVCDQIDNPAAFLVKHGILMGYVKNLEISEFEARIGDKEFSDIANKAAKMLVVDFCSLNKVSYRDLQRIESNLNIPRYRLK